jgi:hypothetical protein
MELRLRLPVRRGGRRDGLAVPGFQLLLVLEDCTDLLKRKAGAVEREFEGWQGLHRISLLPEACKVKCEACSLHHCRASPDGD